MSNYPPGVTGNEFAITGPTNEWEAFPEGECFACRWSDDTEKVIWQSHFSMGQWWICPSCEVINDVEIDELFDFESEGWDEKDDDYEDYDYPDYGD